TSPPPVPYLQNIPAELWIACWTLCSKSDLRSISMVCKVFRSICLPLLLQNQSLDVRPSERSTYGRWEERSQQLQHMADRLETLVAYAPLVRSWRISIGLTGRESDSHPNIEDWRFFNNSYERVLITFGATLGLYRNLSSLHLEWFVVDEPFRDILASLLVLEDLTLSNCDIFHYDGFLKLKSFAEFGSSSEAKLLRIASVDSLQTLKLDGGRIFLPIIRGFGTENLTQLVDLSLEELHNVTIFFGVLKRCPRLQSLRITALTRTSSISLDDTTPDSVDPSWIPLLRSIAVPSVALIRMLVPNRPISEVTVTVFGSQSESPVHLSAEELMALLMDIASSSAPLESLVLPGADPTLGCLIFIAKRFPQLRQLSMVIQETGTRVVEGRPDSHDRSGPSKPFPVLRRNKLPDITSASNVHNILRWIFCGDILLPPRLEVLKLEADVIVRESFSSSQLQQVAKAVCRLCPGLRELHLHRSSLVQTGKAWKTAGSDLE
ncbi:hypothetical protein B0H14DRAFT_2808313, partial [Mycena olivaceomarginata]